ncbi:MULTISPECIES: VCBS repeat-containing protein [unclassified Streptomyces]|uniref:FG-GAP repeat domain-containing protein n=1 Tax=unclassified Streptomyces TaxID=2593676 RepID=UPI001655231B|nr:VCBS repeat-containing protein [Streptomyces sp. CB02980]MCB8903932.1 VCBS repeat-containing protein [Streptomyces sp. CB02980]
MRHTSPRRLTTAVTAVLAVTLAAGALTVPAIAAPATGTTSAAAPAAAADAVISIPRTSSVISSGPSGFLAMEYSGGSDAPVYRWTSTVDGTTKALPALTAYHGGFSDIVVSREPSRATYRVYDMSSPDAAYESWTVSGSPTLQGVVGSTLLMSTWNEANLTGELRLKTRGIGVGSDRQVTGLPTNARILRAEPASASTALVHYTARDAESAVHHYLALVDTVTASVVEKRETGVAVYSADSAVSASRFAWVETSATGPTATLMHAERGGEGAGPTGTPIPLGNGANTRLAFLGDWLTYALPNADNATEPNPLHALTAHNLSTGAKVKLLDHAGSSVPSVDGTLLVRGGTLAHGEGVYRISLGENGTPVATLVASTGQPTALKITDSKVPTVVALDENDGKATLEWTLSRPLAAGTVKLRHVRTGRTVIDHTFDSSLNWTSGTGLVQVKWNDRAGSGHAPNGDYVWEFSATPKNGIGPAVKQTGTLKVVRKANPHDFNDNGSPDLLALDAAGVLWRDDVVDSDSSAGITSVDRTKLSAGFQAYNLIEAAGNHAGGPAGDFVARDASGILWSFLGKGDGTFVGRTKVGPGWQAYNKIAAGSDLTGDGRPDIVATDAAGVLWLHKGTGVWNSPYATRTKVGAGWGIYNQITAVGDIAGGPAGDLVARDTSGILWSLLGKGDGTFAGRTQIGTGFNAYTQLVGAGDIDKDGRPDVVAYGPAGTYVYLGTGLWSAPFSQKQHGSLYFGEGSRFKIIV